jgi:hypothetical protein
MGRSDSLLREISTILLLFTTNSVFQSETTRISSLSTFLNWQMTISEDNFEDGNDYDPPYRFDRFLTEQ